jgi:hypothetical protein
MNSGFLILTAKKKANWPQIKSEESDLTPKVKNTLSFVLFEGFCSKQYF